MVEAISIGTAKNAEAVINRFDHEVKTLNSQGINFKYRISYKGNITFLGCDLHDKNISPEKFKLYLAEVLTDIIYEDWASLIVNKIIRDHYYYFSEEEKKSIKSKVLELILNEGNKYYPSSRKKQITEKIKEYLDKNDELILDGFINFRLKDYMLEIQGLVDDAVDDFLMEKEYLEFIRLLRYFVDIQEPKVEEIHILLKKDAIFQLVDKDGKTIENEYLNGFSVDLMTNSINYDDLLISALITLAPKEVTIHTKEQDEFKETLKTIENIFGERLRYCPGCKICLK